MKDMISEKDLNIIHKYLEDSLSQKEIELFKEKFNNDPEFAKEVKRYTDLRIALKTASAGRLKIAKKSRIIQISWNKLAIAASFVILVALGSMFFLINGQKPIHQKLYAEYYENPLKDKEELISRSGIDKVEPSAMEDFSLAIYYMEDQQFDRAVEVFESFTYQQHKGIMDEVDWYLALCYLNIGEKQKALNLFIEILNSNSIYNNKARDIYNDLTKKQSAVI